MYASRCFPDWSNWMRYSWQGSFCAWLRPKSTFPLAIRLRNVSGLSCTLFIFARMVESILRFFITAICSVTLPDGEHASNVRPLNSMRQRISPRPTPMRYNLILRQVILLFLSQFRSAQTYKRSGAVLVFTSRRSADRCL